nr:MAG TPA: hypothetical protein [Caudoviricetes sp.]
MAHRADRANSQYTQIHYRPKHFKTLKLFAWLTIVLLSLCVVALAVS